jgi:hypothetical protein
MVSFFPFLVCIVISALIFNYYRSIIWYFFQCHSLFLLKSKKSDIFAWPLYNKSGNIHLWGSKVIFVIISFYFLSANIITIGGYYV